MGSGAFGYTTIGEQVGMAQRMESAAPPGGVMLSASTARLVDGTAVSRGAGAGADQGRRRAGLGAPPAGHGAKHRAVRRDDSALVGRRWEMSAVEGFLEGASRATAQWSDVVGPPGIGKSRLVREVAAMAQRNGVRCVHAPSASRTPTRFLFMRSRGCCARPPAWTVSTPPTARARIRAAPRMPTPRTCCCSMTCWASVIPMSRFRRSIRMRVAGG